MAGFDTVLKETSALMYLFKASGKTYRRVVKGAVHAFPHSPTSANLHEVVFLAKNRQDCRPGEQQIRFTARIRQIRRARPAELETLFPSVGAEERWTSVIRLYNVRALDQPFELAQVKNLDAKHYRTVQGFARFKESDAEALITFLIKTNHQFLLDMANAEGPDEELDL